MKNGTLRIALSVGFLALGASTAVAQVALASSDADAREVRVVNDYHTPVRVYVQDAESRLHHLGRVLPSTAQSLEIDAEIAAKGSFRIKVFPVSQPWTQLGEDSGVRSRDITLEEGEIVTFWVERDLTNSRISVARG